MILSKSELCAIIGIPTTTFTSEAIAGQIAFGTTKFLKPILGAELLAHLSGTVTSELDLRLQEVCKLALAHLVYANYIPSLSISLTGSGIGVTNTENTKAASEARLAALESQHKELGYNYLEMLLEELRFNADSLSNWHPAGGLVDCFIKSLADFERYYSIGGSGLTFFSLRNIINRVERANIIPLLGKALHQEFMNLLDTAIGESETETKKRHVIELLCEASVLLTVAQSLVELPVRLSSEGLFIYPFTDVMGTKMRSAPDAQAVKALQLECEQKGLSLLQKASNFIASNLTDFDGYVLPSSSTNANPPILSKSFAIL